MKFFKNTLAIVVLCAISSASAKQLKKGSYEPSGQISQPVGNPAITPETIKDQLLQTLNTHTSSITASNNRFMEEFISSVKEANIPMAEKKQLLTIAYKYKNLSNLCLRYKNDLEKEAHKKIELQLASSKNEKQKNQPIMAQAALKTIKNMRSFIHQELFKENTENNPIIQTFGYDDFNSDTASDAVVNVAQTIKDKYPDQQAKANKVLLKEVNMLLAPYPNASSIERQNVIKSAINSVLPTQ